MPQAERGTTWFLRSRRLGDDMAQTIGYFKPGVDVLTARLPELLETDERTRSGGVVSELTGKGVPLELAQRVATLPMLYATLDIAEVSGQLERPAELVASIYFDLANRLGIPWLRDKIGKLPGNQHWQMLAKGAMLDDLSGLQRAITRAVLASSSGAAQEAAADLVAAWQHSNDRTLQRAQQLLGELRAVSVPDSAMLSVTLRELRGLG